MCSLCFKDALPVEIQVVSCDNTTLSVLWVSPMQGIYRNISHYQICYAGQACENDNTIGFNFSPPAAGSAFDAVITTFYSPGPSEMDPFSVEATYPLSLRKC